MSPEALALKVAILKKIEDMYPHNPVANDISAAIWTLYLPLPVADAGFTLVPKEWQNRVFAACAARTIPSSVDVMALLEAYDDAWNELEGYRHLDKEYRFISGLKIRKDKHRGARKALVAAIAALQRKGHTE